MSSREAGFREVEHTADWQLDVWAPDLPALLEQAAIGMQALAGTVLGDSPRIEREIRIQSIDTEHLLVSFLQELLYLSEAEGLAADTFDLQIHGDVLHAKVTGAPILQQTKEIKAVTYHNLEVRPTFRGLEASIVFDV